MGRESLKLRRFPKAMKALCMTVCMVMRAWVVLPRLLGNAADRPSPMLCRKRNDNAPRCDAFNILLCWGARGISNGNALASRLRVPRRPQI